MDAWENYYETEPERTDIYVVESYDGKHSRQLSRADVMRMFKPKEFKSILDGNHPIWIGYKRD